MLMGLLEHFRKKKKIIRNKDTGTAFERYYKSFFHAIDGIVYAIVCEHNMIIILIAAFLAVLMGMWLSISLMEWLFVILIIGMIAATELINTAIEAVVDLSSPKFHKLAKIAKDTASSATLILSFTALLGGIIIFLPKILEQL